MFKDLMTDFFFEVNYFKNYLAYVYFLLKNEFLKKNIYVMMRFLKTRFRYNIANLGFE